MSRRKKVYGKCKICGTVGKLSFEHVPPSKAFNNEDYYYSVSEKLMLLDLDENLDYIKPDGKSIFKKGQGGFGYYSLCESCNNKTGSWYASDFVSWAQQSMGILMKEKNLHTTFYPTSFYPLRVIKQIICMFFSINNDDFREREPDLVKFLLNKEMRNLPYRYNIYCYYSVLGRKRVMGEAFLGDFSSGAMKTIHLCEFAFPPFGFVMTIDSDPPDLRLADITYFSKFEYNEKQEVHQRFSILPTYLSYIPADYRTKDEIVKAIKDSKDKEPPIKLQ